MSATERGLYRAGSQGGCGCGCGADGPCVAEGPLGLERTRYFPRMLVGPEDLTQDQLHARASMRRHNRLLHGWGVVCGLRVKAGKEPCSLVVEAGYALGPWGDEIVVPDEVTLDACAEDGDGNAAGPCAAVDPWCSPVRVSRDPGRPLYLAVRYAECDSRPVRVSDSGCGCGCDEDTCEYSRVRDSFALKLLTELPESYRPMPEVSDGAMTCVGGAGRACPPCPADPWVVLADVTVSGDAIESIDCYAHRRYVASFADFYFMCRPKDPEPPPPALPPVILAHWPPNGVDLNLPRTEEERRWRASWLEHKRIEITFDREMEPEQLKEWGSWLCVRRVANLFEFLPAERAGLQWDPNAVPTLTVVGFTAVFEVGELEAVGGPLRYLVQVRSGGGAIVGTEPPHLDLDSDFVGTRLTAELKDKLMDQQFQIGIGLDDWDALTSTGATLPRSGDGTPGGRFDLVFEVPNPNIG
jgi:hypothetical protein